MKLCDCGCGNAATISTYTDVNNGAIKGHPLRFIHGHNSRGKNSPTWKGGRFVSGGYVLVQAKDHPRSDKRGYVLEHILIAEKALGRMLPDGAEVHHVNEQRGDNHNSNLVICEDHTYHFLLHRRAIAYRNTGSPIGVKCTHCKKWGIPGEEDMNTVYRPNGQVHHSYHRVCDVLDVRNRKALRDSLPRLRVMR